MDALPAGSVPLGGAAATKPPPPPPEPVVPETPPLPLLPIPTLDETLDRFLEIIRPLITKEQLAETTASVEAFRSGLGPELHGKLLEWEPTEGNRTYLERLWFDAYLKPRSPIAIHVNPFFVLEEDPTPSRNSQVERAASLITSCLKFHQAIVHGSLEADTARGTPLCMYQYGNLFHASRIPGKDSDEFVRFPDARHIVVMCRGLHYWFNVYSSDGTNSLRQEEIAANLRMIREDAWSMTSQECYDNAIGVMTGVGRDEWARVRGLLSQEGGDGGSGAQSLRVIDSALFVVCLDHVSPHSLSEQSQNCLSGTYDIEAGLQVGTCLNRWYDKSLQIIVCENGSAGVNFEHSHLDGHTVLRFASDVFTDTILRFAQTIRGGVPSVLGSLPHTKPGTTPIEASPKKIVWRMDAAIRHAVRRAEAKLSDRVCRVEMQGLEFSGFGKSAIIAEKCSPDAFVQLSIQLAYYRLYGELKSTYETVMTKMYDHGRTEAQRSCTLEALEFARLFCSDAPNSAKIAAFRAAMAAQVTGTKLCAKGKGVDRHLMVLAKLAEREGMPMPDLYSSPGYREMTHNVLSTSNCGNPSLRLFGFAPVVPDGYGIGYLIKNDGVQFSISSFCRQTSRFQELLRRSMTEIRELLGSERTAGPIDPLPAGSITLGGPRVAYGAGAGAGAGAAGPAGAGGASEPTHRHRHPSISEPHDTSAVVRDLFTSMLSGADSPSSKVKQIKTIAATAGVPVPAMVSQGSPLDDDSLHRFLNTAVASYTRR